MQIYYSNTTEIAVPKLKTSARNGDFGMGIYMYEEKEQARLQASLLARREALPYGVISIFDTPIGLMNYSALRIKKFKKPCLGWLDFVLKNRRKPHMAHSYDIVSGPALDDHAYGCLNAFESGLMERNELINVLKNSHLPTQILFHTPKSLLFLDFTGKEKVPCPKK